MVKKLTKCQNSPISCYFWQEPPIFFSFSNQIFGLSIQFRYSRFQKYQIAHATFHKISSQQVCLALMIGPDLMDFSLMRLISRCTFSFLLMKNMTKYTYINCSIEMKCNRCLKLKQLAKNMPLVLSTLTLGRCYKNPKEQTQRTRPRKCLWLHVKFNSVIHARQLIVQRAAGNFFHPGYREKEVFYR